MANQVRSKSSKSPTIRAVTSFEFIHPNAREVFLAGSFSDWAPMPMLSLESGRWVKQLTLPPGRHEYRFVMDGEWVDDPAATEFVSNPHGGRNAVLIVGATALAGDSAQTK
jgi:1,4-alpha-glucan branching enzyme